MSRAFCQSKLQLTPADSNPDVSASAERPVSWKLLIPNIASDQKRIWLFPWSVAHGKGWRGTLAVSTATAALVALDPIDVPYFRRTTTFHTFNKVFSGNNTFLATVAVPVAFYCAGTLRRDAYASRTALLAGEAVASAEILATAMKDVDRRLRPIDIGPSGDLADSWFRSRGNWWRGAGSFPSGHTIGAFSVATIVSRRYSNHLWVPYLAYGAAGLIGFSRITLLSHFPSDVFMGAALGYSISRFAVLRQ